MYAMVSPLLLGMEHPLAGVNDVFNAVFIHGNMVDDTMFYGRGAGSLPTASAVVGDVVECVRRRGNHMDIVWEPDKQILSDFGDDERRFFVRMPADTPDEMIEELAADKEAAKAGIDAEEDDIRIATIMTVSSTLDAFRYMLQTGRQYDIDRIIELMHEISIRRYRDMN